VEISELIHLIKNDERDKDREFILEELYWSNLSELDQESIERIISPFVLESKTKGEIAGAIKLYGNPDGAHIELFQKMIIELYRKNPLSYIEAATDYPAEGLDTLYIFRNKSIFQDVAKEKESLIAQAENDNMKSKIDLFFRMYDNLCNT
jgi:hypothetical protein